MLFFKHFLIIINLYAQNQPLPPTHKKVNERKNNLKISLDILPYNDYNNSNDEEIINKKEII